MATNKNYSTVDGTLFEKPINEGISKKGNPYRIQTLVLELQSKWEDKEGHPHEKNDLVEFRLTKNVQSVLDSYAIGDPIAVSYSLGGKKYDGPRGIRYINEAVCSKIEFSDLDSNGIRPRKKLTNDSIVQPKQALPDFDIPIMDDDDSDLPF
jgi:hypothetical protein